MKRIIPGVLYGLTPKGGKLWERIYNVLWNNYIRQEEEFDTELHYYSINEEAIREAAALIEKSGITSIENTIEKVTSWQVTNWKALENAWRLKIKKSKNPSPHEKEIMDRVRNFTSSFSENFKLEDPVI